MEKAKRPTGYEIWRGPSRLDEAPIVLIATFIKGANANRKTGPMVQTWILRQDVAPVYAMRNGLDSSICGDCKLRPQLPNGAGRSCYVHAGMMDTIWATWKRDRYPKAGPQELGLLLAGRDLRLGSYGDPAAVPPAVWESMLEHAEAHTGYTHAWETLEKAADKAYSAKRTGESFDGAAIDTRDWFQSKVMASTQDLPGTLMAQTFGWRTFRTMTEGEEPMLASFDPEALPIKPEALCPASKEGGYRSTCRECQLCDGTSLTDRRRSVAIYVHGWSTATANYRRMRASLPVLQDGAQ